MPFTLQNPPLEFLQTAKWIIQAEGVVPGSVDDVFNMLADAPQWPTWFSGMTEANWTSASPYGVGSTRVVAIGPLRAWARFIVWEPGARMAFVITETNLPGVTAMMEDLQLQMEAEGKTRIRYRIALQFACLLQPFGGLVRMQINRLLRQSLRTLAQQLTTNDKH